MSTSTMAAEEDLEALFDRIASERTAGESASGQGNVEAACARTAARGGAEAIHACLEGSAATPRDGEDRLFVRVGQLTRTLHDALCELGYDKKLAAAASSLPDARDRLAYIASLTGRAADRVLGAVEQGQTVQQDVESRAASLAGR